MNPIRNTYWLIWVILMTSRRSALRFSDNSLSYRKKLIRLGAIYEQENSFPEYAEHGTIFQIGEVPQLLEKYAQKDDLYLEVQIWDAAILDRWRLHHHKGAKV